MPMDTLDEVPDRIEKTILLPAPLNRVWRAVSNAREFGSWFGVEFDAAFTAGGTSQGRIVPTEVDPAVAKLQEPHRGATFEWMVESIEPERVIVFRWHPFAIEKDVDYSQEPTTRITFLMEAVEGGTHLTITESGFGRIPLERRAKAFAANEGGWEHQTKLIEKYLARQGA